MLEIKLLHELVLDLIQLVQAVFYLQINLRVLEMVPNNFDVQNYGGLKKSRC